MAALKILLILVVLFLLFFPLLPLSKRLKRFSTFRSLRYDAPHNRINAFFILLTVLEFVVMAILFRGFAALAGWIASIGFVSRWLASTSASLDFRAATLTAVLVNLVAIYLLVFFKGVFKSALDVLFGFRKRKKKKKQEEEADENTPAEEDEEQNKKKPRRIFDFFRSKRKKKEETKEAEDEDEFPERKTHAEDEQFREEHPILYRLYIKFWGFFFEAPDLKHSRRFVHAATAVVQFFIYVVEILYALLFLLLLLAVFFTMPAFVYSIVGFVTTKLYLYPFVSIIFLQELCNTFRAPCKPPRETNYTLEKEKREQEENKRIALDKLRRDLLRRFAKHHSIRYFPATDAKEVAEYECTSEVYRDSMKYIGTYMKRNYGKVIQSYMSGLDAVFNERHVYFGSSFYSQLGEYVISYTYVRLLAGYRVIFIVSDRSKVEGLQQYIGNRLTEITGVTREETWRVYSADSHHLNEADVLVGVPEDFASDNLVENYPAFFEEACNAIFVDADKILNLNSYLCSIMACRLFAATENKIRFMFLSRDVMQGFSASLRKFFCIDEEIVDCNSAEENEHVSYMLWSRESNSNVLYNKDGQSETTIESLIAEMAYDANVDGIRILTSVPLSPAEKQNFQTHDVEINHFYKQVPRVNYLIYTDDRCNLAAAIYAYTRFHGREDSILHILSRPYLLREYFLDRVEMYVNRSDLIKPRATEHADTSKILLLRLLCEATSSSSGIPISYFTERIDAALKEKGKPLSADLNGAVAFLLSELMSEPKMVEEKTEKRSDGTEKIYTAASKNRPVYNYYTLIQPEDKDGYQLKSEMHISFLRIEEVFERLLVNNTRVELSLHGTVIGTLDTFPERVYQQYLPGQYIIFENHEYEIERIAKDRRTIYLRQENTTNNSCLDSAFLRRYTVTDKTDVKSVLHGVQRYSVGNLAEIDVGYESAAIIGETYGFYRLMANSQTLNFVKGVGGNNALDPRTVEEQARRLADGKILTVRLVSREACTDGTRKLLAAVLNEFLRTMFPETYRCVAVCPVLLTPTVPAAIEKDFDRAVETLYPYLVGDALTAEANVVELLIINDAQEDVGVLDRLYDGGARIVEELLSYVYDYLMWLSTHPKLPAGDTHYIYFGADALPAVYDLAGSIALLANCERTVSIEEDDGTVEKPTHCSFCKQPLVSGRYALYDKHRYICFDCQVEALSEDKDLDKALADVKSYWNARFPTRTMPEGITFELAPPFSLQAGEELSEHFSHVHLDTRTVEIECDLPYKCVFVAALRAYLSFFHKDEKLITPAAMGQLYYEELAYLVSVGATERAEFTKAAIAGTWMPLVDEITEYVATAPEGETRDSFDYLFAHAIPPEDTVEPTPGTEDETGSEGMDALYDPDRVPRFWKRYLRGMKASDDDSDDGREPATAEDDPEDASEDTETDAAEDGAEEATDNTAAEETADTKEPPAEEEKKKPKKPGKLSQLKSGAELIPYEEEEATNPRLRLYNEIARHIADFSDEMIPCYGLSLEEARRIFQLVQYDYPEFFWVDFFNAMSRGAAFVGITLRFRCLDSEGKVDIARVQKYRKELRSHVKFFTKGITKKTKPYDAMLTIYRRLILNLDYDDEQVESGIDGDMSNEDVLRSLHSALVEHKVVCVGYAVAAQYLLQSVGICCGQVVSQTHAWNVVKLGKYCYYLDVTWGDPSKTTTGEQFKNVVGYSYFCVPLKENLFGSDERTRLPDPTVFKGVENFCATKHEYCRVHGGYLTSYDEDQIVRAIVAAVKEKPFEKMTPSVSFRCASKPLYDMVVNDLWTKHGIRRVIAKARAVLEAEGKKSKKALKLLDRNLQLHPSVNLAFQIVFLEE